jgi:hypothetical protein
MYRYRNGRFKSKKDAELQRRLVVYTTMTTLTIALIFGFALQPWTVTYQNVVHEAQAFEGLTDLCGLSTVECEGEVDDTVQTAINAVSESLGREVTDETKKRIAYLHEQSVKNGVPFFDAVKTIHCESGWTAQKSHYAEESWGIAQIHLPSHKGITKEQAMDAYFSIDFLVAHWYTPQAVKDKMWFGFSRATGKCTNGIQIDL